MSRLGTSAHSSICVLFKCAYLSYHISTRKSKYIAQLFKTFSFFFRPPGHRKFWSFFAHFDLAALSYSAVRHTYLIIMKLSSFSAGQSAVITHIGAEGALAERLNGLGVRAGSRVRILRFAPFRGGIMLETEGVRLALRLSLAEKISAIPANEEDKS